jgi:hypothetical protein
MATAGKLPWNSPMIPQFTTRTSHQAGVHGLGGPGSTSWTSAPRGRYTATTTTTSATRRPGAPERKVARAMPAMAMATWTRNRSRHWRASRPGSSRPEAPVGPDFTRALSLSPRRGGPVGLPSIVIPGQRG